MMNDVLHGNLQSTTGAVITSKHIRICNKQMLLSSGEMYEMIRKGAGNYQTAKVNLTVSISRIRFINVTTVHYTTLQLLSCSK